jgi:serine/threonine protein kinase
MVLDYAEGGNLYNWVNKHYNKFDWSYNIEALLNIIEGLKKIHERQMVHRDLHTGNILSMTTFLNNYYPMNISDMGLCGKVNNTVEKNIYGVMPYVAPEVLRGRPYTQAADIYSFGMIMYFVATGRQPFSNCAHDEILALDICKGIKPEINDQEEVPKCYIDLMKRCWNLNPDNRPKATEIVKLIRLFHGSYVPNSDWLPFEGKEQQHYDIEKQFKKADEYKETNFLFLEERSHLKTHPQAVYTSRLLNSFTKDLPKYDLNSECLDCEITYEI